MTDGTVTLSSAASDYLQFNLGSTDGTGIPTAWGITACGDLACSANSNMSSASNEPELGNDTTNQQGYSSPYYAATGADDQGSWTVAAITGTIGGYSTLEDYSFLWAGGAFSATASVTGANPGASYLFSEGAAGTCSGGGAATLNGSDSFSGTIAIGNLAAGQYCIGLDANNPSDPAFALTFNTPVEGVVAVTLTPEPSTFALLSLGLGLAGLLRPRRTA
jgi:hypothetical protein